jgi:hypothetical protein
VVWRASPERCAEQLRGDDGVPPAGGAFQGGQVLAVSCGGPGPAYGQPQPGEPLLGAGVESGDFGDPGGCGGFAVLAQRVGPGVGGQRGDRGLVGLGDGPPDGEPDGAERVEDSDVRHLHWLRDRIGEELIDAIVIYAGERAYRRRDDVAVVPLALLGP